MKTGVMIFKKSEAMKKNVFSFLCIGALLSVYACQKEPAFNSVQDHVHMVISATQANTKTTLDGTTTTWKEGDKVTVMYKKTGESSWTTAPSDPANPIDGYAKVSFPVDLFSPDTEADAYAFYPANNVSPTTTLAKITIASTQYPTGTSFDGNSDILISNAFKPTAGTVSTQFARVGAVLKIKIKNASLSTEKLLSLSVTGENALAGNIPVNLSSHAKSGTITNASNTVTAVYTSSNQFTIGSADRFVYLIVSPQTLASGSTLTVSGITENYTFSRDIVIPQDIHLNAGHIVPLNITIESLTTKVGWYRIEDASWLSVDDHIVIVNNDGTKAMSNTQGSSNNRGEVSIEVTGKKITKFNNDAQVFTLETGTVSGSFALWCDGGDKFNNYIYAAGSSSNNYLKSQLTLDGNASFVAELSNDGFGSLTAHGTNTNNALRYNSGNKLFSCYSSSDSQKDISIYKYYGNYSDVFAEFRFDKTEDLEALNITLPSSGTGTVLNEDTDYTVGNVTMTITYGSGTKTRVYNSGTYDLRAYNNGGTIVFNAGSKTIKRIEFLASSFAMTASEGTLSSKIWSGEASIVTLTPTGTNYISIIRITYE